MLTIKCKKCGEIIEIGKDQYNALLNDLEKEELDKRVKERTEEIERTYKTKLELEFSKIKSSQDNTINDLNTQIKVLKEKLSSSSKDVEVAVSAAVLKTKDELSAKNEEIAKLKGEIANAKKDADLLVKNLNEQYQFQLKAKDEEIERYKDFRLGNSTKALGESLEQYCHDEFDKVRAVAYPNAYFEKDNEVINGSKGDFIFRDYKDGIETVSIMFDMKNQNDETKTKHKNTDFLDELDKDRKLKKCEYAVLVSTLEEDSGLYNNGIVDMSHKHPKMFVVRPQFFLAIIGLIRNMANNSFEYKKQMVEYQRENLDVTNFEAAVRTVAQKISDDYDNATKQYEKVETMCDDMIKKLQAFKEAFRLGQTWIGRAQNQLPNLEVRKLTKDNKTMKEKFDALERK